MLTKFWTKERKEKCHIELLGNVLKGKEAHLLPAGWNSVKIAGASAAILDHEVRRQMLRIAEEQDKQSLGLQWL